MAANGTEVLAKVGILSIGDMGVGIASRLGATGFTVATNCQGRSQDTVDRAKSVNVQLLPSDSELVEYCDVLLSVVPPRDAVATAQRVIDALSGSSSTRQSPLYFADMNAVAPSTVKEMCRLFERSGVSARFIDASIIGGPPAPTKKQQPADGPGKEGKEEAGEEAEDEAEERKEEDEDWYLPLIPTSGPHKLSDIPGFGPQLSRALRLRHLSDEVGAASGLKMCFASLTKGYTAVAIQAYATARRLGVLGELRAAVGAADPARLRRTDRALVDMAPKAYRWVREMEEIAATHDEEGGFAPDLFRGVAGVYRAVADDTVLGRERVGKRERGMTAEDVASAVAEGLERKRKKTA